MCWVNSYKANCRHSSVDTGNYIKDKDNIKQQPHIIIIIIIIIIIKFLTAWRPMLI
jgi:hypothetical protein